MPLVRIDIIQGRTAAQRRSLGDAVHRALVEALGVPAADRFQVITEHERNELVYDRGYLNIDRSDGIVLIQITLSTGRTLEQKRQLYVETARENWSFGLGEASYAPAEKVRA